MQASYLDDPMAWIIRVSWCGQEQQLEVTALKELRGITRITDHYSGPEDTHTLALPSSGNDEVVS